MRWSHGSKRDGSRSVRSSIQAVIKAAWTASSARWVAEDLHRDRQASVAHHARQGVERFRVALLRLADQFLVHPSLHSVAIGRSGPITS